MLHREGVAVERGDCSRLQPPPPRPLPPRLAAEAPGSHPFMNMRLVNITTHCRLTAHAWYHGSLQAQCKCGPLSDPALTRTSDHPNTFLHRSGRHTPQIRPSLHPTACLLPS